MKKVFLISIFILLITSSLSLSQQPIDPSSNSVVAPIINSLEDVDNQQINEDEGYGPNDAEYYNAEGLNSEDSKIDDQTNQSN